MRKPAFILILIGFGAPFIAWLLSTGYNPSRGVLGSIENMQIEVPLPRLRLVTIPDEGYAILAKERQRLVERAEAKLPLLARDQSLLEVLQELLHEWPNLKEVEFVGRLERILKNIRVQPTDNSPAMLRARVRWVPQFESFLRPASSSNPYLRNDDLDFRLEYYGVYVKPKDVSQALEILSKKKAEREYVTNEFYTAIIAVGERAERIRSISQEVAEELQKVRTEREAAEKSLPPPPIPKPVSTKRELHWQKTQLPYRYVAAGGATLALFGTLFLIGSFLPRKRTA